MKGEEVDPQYEVEDVEDLSELLARAGNWAEGDVGADVVAAEFREARDFVEEHLVEEKQLVTDGGECQTALTSHAGLEVAEPVRDEDRHIRCPDCKQIVSESKGSHAAPDSAATDRIWGWMCSTCENTLPSNALREDAPTFNDRMTAVEVVFRDGSKRLVPAPKTQVDGGEVDD